MATTGRVGVPTMRQYENMFKDILGRSGLPYGYGKHFMDKTERFSPDDLYTDVRRGEIRLARRAAYPVGDYKHTVVGLELPITISEVQVQAKFTNPTDTTFGLEVSADGGVEWIGVTFTQDAGRDIQYCTTMGIPVGSSLRARILMATDDAQVTPTLEWFMLMFKAVS